MRQTIRLRLALWFVGLVLLVLGLFAGIVTAVEMQNEAQELEQALRAAARWAAQTSDASTPAQPELPTPSTDVVAIRVLSREGALLRQYGDPSAAAAMATTGPARGLGRTVTLPGGRALRVLRVAGSRGRVVEVAGAPPDYRELIRLLSGVAEALPVTLAAAVLAAFFLAERALRPVHRITRAARELGAGDLSRRIALPGPDDEIKQLADTFDAMLERLERAFAAQRRFAGDASHELRTPLTIMRGHAEVALADPNSSAPELRGALQIVSAELRRLSKLTEDLLMLQRADAGEHRLTREPVDLAALAEEVIEGLQPLAPGRRLSVESRAPALVWVDPVWIRQLLINLVENAVRHTPVDGRIVVTVGQSGSQVRLAVEDTGAGIAAEHLPHLFDRFYRVEPERSRAHGGAGLGLAIARWIVEAHDGTIGVESEPGRGSRFTVSFPAADDSGPREARTGGPDTVPESTTRV